MSGKGHKVLYLPPSNHLKLLINNYIDRFDEQILFDGKFKFDDNILSLDNEDLELECEKKLDRIKKDVKRLLLMKLIMKEKKHEIDEKIEVNINKRIINEFNLFENEKMKKLFVKSFESDEKCYKEIGEMNGIESETSIFLYKFIVTKIENTFYESNYDSVSINNCMGDYAMKYFLKFSMKILFISVLDLSSII